MNACSCKFGCRCLRCRCGSYARFFELLSDPTRLCIIAVLQKGPKSVSQLVSETQLEQSCVSHSLRKLEENGLVTTHKKGKFHIYERNTAVDLFLKTVDRQIGKKYIREEKNQDKNATKTKM